MPNGKLVTRCGGGEKGDSGDGGPAAQAQLNTPHSLAVGPVGDIYIADTLNHRVRRIEAKTHVITTIAGTTKGFSGDGGPSAKAQFSGIYCIAFNPDKSKLVITDLDNGKKGVEESSEIADRINVVLARNGGLDAFPQLQEGFARAEAVENGAARVEGASSLQILWRVFVPLGRPTYIAFGLVSVSYHWNNFLWPLIVTNSVEARPLTVGLQVFASTDQGIDWSIICAATLMTSAPLLIAFLLFQRQFIQSFLRAGIR